MLIKHQQEALPSALTGRKKQHFNTSSVFDSTGRRRAQRPKQIKCELRQNHTSAASGLIPLLIRDTFTQKCCWEMEKLPSAERSGLHTKGSHAARVVFISFPTALLEEHF